MSAFQLLKRHTMFRVIVLILKQLTCLIVCPLSQLVKVSSACPVFSYKFILVYRTFYLLFLLIVALTSLLYKNLKPPSKTVKTPLKEKSSYPSEGTRTFSYFLINLSNKKVNINRTAEPPISQYFSVKLPADMENKYRFFNSSFIPKFNI